MVDTGSGRGITGGICPAPPKGHSLVSLYVEVEDLPAYVAKAVYLGGHILIRPQTLPDGHQMALLLDPEGIALGIFKPAGGVAPRPNVKALVTEVSCAHTVPGRFL